VKREDEYLSQETPDGPAVVRMSSPVAAVRFFDTLASNTLGVLVLLVLLVSPDPQYISLPLLGSYRSSLL